MSKHRYFDGHGKSSHPHGTHGNDIVYGDDKPGHGGPFSWLWSCKPAGYVDYLDGGAGSDKVYGGGGNDFANYTLSENLGTHDVYDGGRGTDTLQLKLTYGEFALASVKQDIARYEAFLASHSNPLKDNGATFHFNSFNLDASDFEKLKIDLVNTRPTAKNDAATTNEDTVLKVAKTAGVLANDTDPDHLDVLHVTGFSHTSALGAAVVVNADGSYSYDPTGVQALQALAQGANVTDSFTYTVADLAGATSCATVKIKVTGLNDGLVARDDAYTATEDSALTIPAAGVLGNDTAGSPLHAVLVAGPAHGSLTLNDNGSFVYTPNADFNGNDSFSYRANDGSANSATALVSISVAAVNDVPVANGEYATVTEDSSSNVIQVLANDKTGPVNEAGQTLTVTAAEAEHGAVRINVDGTLSYTPNADYFGADTISYTVKDNGTSAGVVDPLTATASVHVNVTEINDKPVAADESATVAEDSSGNVIQVLANDRTGPVNEAGQTLSVTAAAALHGSVTINGDGTLSYAPNADFFGADTISYTVSDNGTSAGASDPLTDTASVHVNVTEINDKPVAVDDSATVAEDSNGNVIGVLGNDKAGPANETGQTLTVTTAAAEHGAVTINADGTLSYAPDADFFGTDTISYTVKDNGTTGGVSDPLAATASVHVNVTESNDVPTALGDTATLDEDSTATIAVLANDTAGPNEAGQTLTVTAAEAGHGAVTINADGTLSYTPEANYNGKDSISYTIRDDGTTNGADDAKSATATVEITVKPVNDFPFAVDDTAATDEDTAISGNVLTGASGGQDTDVDGDTLTVTTTGTFASDFGAAVTLSADGTFIYDPTESSKLQALGTGASEIDHFDYSISDGQGGTRSATVNVTVAGADEPSVSGQVLDSVSPFAEMHSFLRIGDGDWLELDSFSMGLANSGTIGTGAGGTGDASAQGVNVLLGSSAQILTLTDALTSGKVLDHIEIESYVNGENGLQLVDEFKFNNVLVSHLDINNGVENSLGFDFASFTHGHVEQDATHSSVTGWDFGKDQALAGDAPQAEATEGPLAQQVRSDAELHSFVRIEGGDWLELDMYSLGQENEDTGSTGGGAGTGKALANDVFLHLGSSAQILALTGALADGKLLGNVEIETYANADDGLQLVDEFKFNNVLVTDLANGNGLAGTLSYDLSFDYGSFTHGHVEQDATHSSVTGWDFTKNVALAGDMPQAEATKEPLADQVSPNASLDYYVHFDGTDGWLRLDSFGMELSNTGTIGTGGASTGESSAHDVNLLLGSSAQILALTDRLAGGDLLKNVEIEAYASGENGPQLVDEFRFNKVLITGLDSSNANTNSLSFDFASFSHGHVEQGTTNASVTGWDFVKNEATTAPLPHADASAPEAQVAPTAEMHSFLRIGDGGDWLELDSFSMGLANSGTIGTGAGGTGDASAQGVNVLLGSSAQILTLTDALTSGKVLDHIEIESYVNGENGLQLVDEFKFNNVLVSHLDINNGVENSLGFDFASFTHGHVEQDATHSSVTGWDFGKDQALAGDAPQAEATEGPLAQQVRSDAELHSFVRIEGGDWLELDMYSLGQENEDTGSTGGGAGTGKALANDVFLHLGSSAQILALTGALADGKLLGNVEIETYANADDGLQLVDEFKFNHVLVTDLANGNGLAGTLSYDLSFDYGSFTHGHVEQDATHSSVTGWDFTKNVALAGDMPQAEATKEPLADQVSPNASLDYYVHFDGTDGWLRLDSFGMELSNTGTIGTGGASTGESSAHDVNLLLGSSAQILALTDRLAGGDLLKNVEIEAYASGENGPQLVDEFRFNKVLITGLDSSNANTNSLSFDFASFSHGHVEQGTTNASVTGWDFVKNEATTAPLPHADVDLFA